MLKDMKQTVLIRMMHNAIFFRYYSSGNKEISHNSKQKTTNRLPESSKESGNWLQGHLSSLYKAKAPRTFTGTLIYKDLLTVRGSWKAIYTDSHSDKARYWCLLIISGLDREQRPSFEHGSYHQPLYGIWRKWVMTSCAHFIAERSHLQRWGLTRTYEPVCGEHKVWKESSPREAGIMLFRTGFSRVLGWVTPQIVSKCDIQIIIASRSDTGLN